MRVLIVGANGGSHIGGSLLRASAKLGVDAQLCDIHNAWRHGTLLQRLLWHFGNRRPARMGRFGREVLRMCEKFHPDLMLATGMAPVSETVLLQCRRMGVRCANYSTDDPFSQVQRRARWFLAALRHYDVVFSPRRANLDDLRRHGCLCVEYLPFGYDPDLFYPPTEPASPEMDSDLFFAGAADRGRAPFIAAALRAGLNVRLHGINWDKYPETRGASLGQADIPKLRQAIRSSRLALCVVRHENRDGHSMRTFEIPAVGACMMVEDTAEHREIFGSDGDAVVYFRSPRELVEKSQQMLNQPAERDRLRDRVHQHITRGHHTYGDRLTAIAEQVLRRHPASLTLGSSRL